MTPTYSTRHFIRYHGSGPDKKIGYSLIPQGTIEWFLIYHIRGQDEGINGILKKKGNLIGDGQKTTWIIGTKMIKNRIHSDIVFIKSRALTYFLVAGKRSHSMVRIYNWDKNLFYIIIFWR